MNQNFTGYVISHTHWDREWYLPFQDFRMRLVNLLDTLIPYLESHPEFVNFHLDGQTIVLEDYLEVRPEMNARLKALIQSHRISIGPWYVLPDLQCIGQESIVRNLNLGIRVGAKMGPVTQIGYLPDIFSHPAQLPQIFEQFGFSSAVIWRGISGTSETLKEEFLWEAPDGTRLFTVHLPDDRGYLNAFPLDSSLPEASKQFDKWFEERIPYAATPFILFMNGCDHQNPNYMLPECIAYFNQYHDSLHLKHTTLTEFIAAVQNMHPNLSVIKGELNYVNQTPGRHLNGSLKNTLSARITQKILNYETETGLIRYLEPLSVLCNIYCNTSFSHFIDTAWKYLLQNHPHDSICGCSCDEVHLDMDRRFAWSQEIIDTCCSEAMRLLSYRFSEYKESSDTDDVSEIPVHFWNPLTFDRNDVVCDFTLRLPIDTFFRDIVITDCHGNTLQSQILGIKKDGIVLHPFHKDPSWDNFQLVHLEVLLPYLPATGFATVFCSISDVPQTILPQTVTLLHKMENEFLSVRIHSNGTLSVTDKLSGQTLSDLHILTDEADKGDEYVFSPEHVQYVWNSLSSAPSIRMNYGRLCSTAEIIWNTPNAELCTHVTLTRNSKIIRFHTKITNKKGNHRLRVLFPVNYDTNSSFADSAFAITSHPFEQSQPKADAWIESENGCFSQKRFVYLCNSSSLFAFMGKGLPEYEFIKTDAGNAIAVPLLRAVDRIGKENSLGTYAPPGPKSVYTPDANLICTYSVSYAICTFSDASDNVDELLTASEQFHGEPIAYQADSNEYVAAEYQLQSAANKLTNSFLKVSDPGFVISCIKESNDHNGVLIRGYNITEQTLDVILNLNFPYRKIWHSNLCEEKLSILSEQTEVLSLCVLPHKIQTLYFEL